MEVRQRVAVARPRTVDESILYLQIFKSQLLLNELLRFNYIAVFWFGAPRFSPVSREMKEFLVRNGCSFGPLESSLYLLITSHNRHHAPSTHYLYLCVCFLDLCGAD